MNECADTSPCDQECADTSPCDQECVNTDGSYECRCYSGYKGQDGDCEDIDECIGVNGCQQTCVNTPGSYNCSCYDGFTLDANGQLMPFVHLIMTVLTFALLLVTSSNAFVMWDINFRVITGPVEIKMNVPCLSPVGMPVKTLMDPSCVSVKKAIRSQMMEGAVKTLMSVWWLC